MEQLTDGKYGEDARLLKSGLHARPGADVSLNSKVYEIDTMSLPRNGAGKHIYPAFWDLILAHPDAVNVAPSLTPVNEFRRTANMAPLYEKYGERANRVVIDPMQLSMDGTLTPDALKRATTFQRMPLQAQVGALNAIISGHAGAAVDDTMGFLGRAYLDPRIGGKDLAELYHKGRALGLEAGAPWRPTTDVSDPRYFKDLARLVHDTANLRQIYPGAVGESSLRRAAIVNDAAERGLTGADLGKDAWITQELGRAHGGSVPRKSGALTQACSCGG
jgi:hypothetical protein